MKKGFEILKDRPKLKIQLTRDSVCAADDINAPHSRNLEIFSFVEPEALINHLAAGYLPSTIQGSGHSWDCLLNDVLVGSISSVGIASDFREIQYGEVNHVHFRYHSSRQ